MTELMFGRNDGVQEEKEEEGGEGKEREATVNESTVETADEGAASEAADTTANQEEDNTEDVDGGADDTENSDVGDILEIAGLDMSELSKEYVELGKLSDESYAELEENGFPKDVVDTYIRGIKAQATEAQEMAEKDVEEVMSIAGGADKYGQMLKWATTNFSEADKEAYNRVIATGDKDFIKFAVQGLTARYESEYGRTPSKLIKGGRGLTKADSAEGYKNVSEMKEAMADRRYGTDPDYTAEVERKTINAVFIKKSR